MYKTPLSSLEKSFTLTVCFTSVSVDVESASWPKPYLWSFRPHDGQFTEAWPGQTNGGELPWAPQTWGIACVLKYLKRVAVKDSAYPPPNPPHPPSTPEPTMAHAPTHIPTSGASNQRVLSVCPSAFPHAPANTFLVGGGEKTFKVFFPPLWLNTLYFSTPGLTSSLF